MKRITPKKQKVPPTPDAWKAELAGINQFLATCRGTKLDEYDFWRKGMMRHYTARKKFLLAHKPRGVK